MLEHTTVVRLNNFMLKNICLSWPILYALFQYYLIAPKMEITGVDGGAMMEFQVRYKS